MIVYYNNKKEIFSEFRDQIFDKQALFSKIFDKSEIGEVKISSLKNDKILEEIKILKVIELDSLEDFYSYVNYDHFLIFKFNNEYYFCDTEFAPSLGLGCMIKIIDFNLYLRKDKMKKIDKFSTKLY